MRLQSLPLLLLVLTCLFGPCMPTQAQTLDVKDVKSAPETKLFLASDLPDLTLSTDSFFIGDFPYWNVFWIFGDGNYTLRDRMIVGNMVDTAAHQYISDSLDYYPAALLIERKTDPPPPGVTTSSNTIHRYPFSITGGSLSIKPFSVTNTGDPIQYDFNILSTSAVDYHRVKLRASHFLKDNNWTAFITEFKPLPINGRLLFFFDTAEGESNHFKDSTETIGPRYGATKLPDLSTIARNADDFGTGAYQYVIDYPLDQVWSGIDNPNDAGQSEGLRIFNLIKSLQNVRGNISRFMVVLAVDEEPEKPWLPVRDSNYTEDIGFLSPYVDANRQIMDSGIPGKSPYYYIDADTLEIAYGEPKDPNGLHVKSVCRCAPKGQYLVTFELKFCNTSTYPTSYAEVYLKDLTKGHIRCFSQVPELSPNSSDTPPPDNTAACQEKLPTSDPFKISYRAIRYVEDMTKKDENCHYFVFTAFADKKGLEAIINGCGVEACVHFLESQVACELTCSRNEPYPMRRNCKCGRDFRHLPLCKGMNKDHCNDCLTHSGKGAKKR